MVNFFIDRPIFAWVIAIVIMLAGGLSVVTLPVAQYPSIAPPAISIGVTYPGASAETVQNTVTQVKIPVRDPKTPSTKDDPMLAASPYNGADPIWDSQAVVHNPMYDELGNLWVTARIRPNENPDFCKKGSDLESAKLFPLNTSGRQLAMLDPKTGKFTLINTCFPTHHLEFGYDKNDTLWTSAGGPAANVVGWLNTKMFRETGDERTLESQHVSSPFHPR